MAFDYPYRQISGILHLSEDHARQLLRRARDHLATERRHQASTTAHSRLVRTFVAAQSGDLAGLEQLLAADVARQVRSASGYGPFADPRSHPEGRRRTSRLAHTRPGPVMAAPAPASRQW
ncbi:hypothetical protein [Nonomuraea maheshkhaliensis]|uniref:hypothetical protein n=1 Tax=Nonomuraea maheshkhaliensis TaxID=419590 RepID=UPI003D1591A0